MVDDNLSPLSMSEAVKAMTQPNGPRNPPQEDTPGPDEDDVEPKTPEEEDDDDLAEGLTEEDEDTPQEEGDGPPEDEEPEIKAGRFAPDSAKVTLADGTVATIAQLKQGTLLQSDYSKKTMQLAEERKAYEAQKAQVAEVENTLAQQRETLALIVQAYLPRPPDPAMLDPQSGQFDVVSYTMQKEAYERQSGMVHQMINDHQQMLARQQAEAEKQRSEIRTSEAERLFERLPELQKPEAYQKFWSEAVATVAEYGFSPEELDAVDDHRTYLVLKDAMAYRRLKAKVAQAKTKTGGSPILGGSTRRSSDVVRAHEAKAAMARLDKTGSMKDGIAALLAREKVR